MTKTNYIQLTFIFQCYGILNRDVVEHFSKDIQPILLTKEQLEKATQIDKTRKELLFEVYRQFGNLSDLKLREMTMSDDSPAGIISSNPTLYYLHLTGKVGFTLTKEMTKNWFMDNFMEI